MGLKVQIKGDGENAWRVSAKVANTMNCQVTKSGEAFSAGPIMGTKMMPVPRLEEREKEVNSVLAGLTSISMEGTINNIRHIYIISTNCIGFKIPGSSLVGSP